MAKAAYEIDEDSIDWHKESVVIAAYEKWLVNGACAEIAQIFAPCASHTRNVYCKFYFMLLRENINFYN